MAEIAKAKETEAARLRGEAQRQPDPIQQARLLMNERGVQQLIHQVEYSAITQK